MQKISFVEIVERLDDFNFPTVDCVIGIATGGMVLGAVLAAKFKCELLVLPINFRDEKNSPKYAEPLLYADFTPDLTAQKVLLVDDVSVSGATLQKAKEILKDTQVTTAVLLGKADYVIFPEIKGCVHWPWRMVNTNEVGKGKV